MIFVNVENPVQDVWDVGDVSGLSFMPGECHVRLDGKPTIWKVWAHPHPDVVLVKEDHPF